MFHAKKDWTRRNGTGWFLVSAVLLAIATSGVDEEVRAQAKIASEEAKKRALAALKGATVTGIELEERDGQQVYEVELQLGTREIEIELIVDADDGSVLAVETEGDDDPDRNDAKREQK